MTTGSPAPLPGAGSEAVRASGSWSAGQLAEFLALVSSFETPAAAMQGACERAGEALEAEVAAVVTSAGSQTLIGFPRNADADEQLLAVVSGASEHVEIPGLGDCRAVSAAVEDAAASHLVVARFGDERFDDADMHLLRGMARVLRLTLRLLEGLEHERELRAASEGEIHEREQAEAKYRELVERLPAIVYVAYAEDDGGRWEYVSPQVADILGFTPEEWLADPTIWASRLHPDDRARVLRTKRDETTLGEQRAGLDYRMIARDGRTVWVLDQAVLDHDDDGDSFFHGVLYDITDRKRAEAELMRRKDQQAAIARLGEHALAGRELTALMDEAVGVTAELEQVECAGVTELLADDDCFILRAGVGFPEGSAGRLRLPAGRRSPKSAVVPKGKVVRVDDWELEADLDLPDVLAELDVRSGLIVPIEGPIGAFGTLEIHSLEQRHFGDDEVHFLQALANILADAIERQGAEEEIRHQALHDPLTGLPNRVLFVDRVRHALAHSRRSGSYLAVMFFDLDNFKLVNDTLGHALGDDLLTAVAPRLQRALRPGDTVARFGGDEFGILVEDIDDEQAAIRVAERIAASFTKPFVLSGSEHFVTTSTGIALSKSGFESPYDLIRDADAAMYRAKERGRARYEFFDQEMRARAIERLSLENDLRRALEREEFELHYQPVVSMTSGGIVGVEALLRWHHPERGRMAPDSFIPIAEESGLIESIGKWVLEEACRQAAVWQNSYPDAAPLAISVNLSARQTGQAELPAIVSSVLAATGIEPATLNLEITESVLIDESQASTQTLARLKDMGVRLVLDDFGTGYSSLSYLNRFELDSLKIDRSFVAELTVRDESTAIVRAIVAMAHAMSLQVIAEGVETPEQRDAARALGCGHAQGFLFARPMPAAELTELLAEQRSGAPLLGPGGDLT